MAMVTGTADTVVTGTATGMVARRRVPSVARRFAVASAAGALCVAAPFAALAQFAPLPSDAGSGLRSGPSGGQAAGLTFLPGVRVSQTAFGQSRAGTIGAGTRRLADRHFPVRYRLDSLAPHAGEPQLLAARALPQHRRRQRQFAAPRPARLGQHAPRGRLAWRAGHCLDLLRKHLSLRRAVGGSDHLRPEHIAGVDRDAHALRRRTGGYLRRLSRPVFAHTHQHVADHRGRSSRAVPRRCRSRW